MITVTSAIEGTQKRKVVNYTGKVGEFKKYLDYLDEYLLNYGDKNLGSTREW